MTGSPQLAVQALNEIAKLLGKLTEEQLTDLVKGQAVVEFRSPEVTITSRTPKRTSVALRTKSKADVDLDEIVRMIRGMDEEDAVERYLQQRDKELTLPLLRELAEKIGPPVSSKGTKAQLRKNIAAGTAGLLNRPASAFGESWDR